MTPAMAPISRCHSVLGRRLPYFTRTAVASPICLGSRSPSKPEPRRTFITLPSPPPQTLSSHMTVPYNYIRVYELIADVDSYRTFLPYCSVSRVTAWTPEIACPPPSDDHLLRRWPLRADLTAGWGAFEETYTSRLTCIPYHIVEAVSGPESRSEVPASELRRLGLPLQRADDDHHHGNNSNSNSGGVFKSLVTRWTITPATSSPYSSSSVDINSQSSSSSSSSWSKVQLDIKFQFANPLYAAVSSTVGDKIAPLMVDAFSKRAHRVLGGQDRIRRQNR